VYETVYCPLSWSTTEPVIDLVPSSSTLNASPPEVLREPDSSFAVMVNEVGVPAVMVATGVPIDFEASVVSEVRCECE
jgi:hypothetical protein